MAGLTESGSDRRDPDLPRQDPCTGTETDVIFTKKQGRHEKGNVMTQIIQEKALLAAGAAIGALMLPQQVWAQSTVDSSATGQDIIVTASKREERLIDVPAAVTSLGGEDLLRRNLTRIEDFAAQVPGFSFQNVGTRAVRLILRGQNSGGAGATVATVIDEVPLSYSSSTANGAIDTANIETWDLNRIEVLRGPQGTLYGATAQGGLLKYVTNAPDPSKAEAAGQVGFESVSDGNLRGQIRVMANVPIVEGKVALRLTGFYVGVPGYVDNPLLGEKDVNSGFRLGGRAQLLLKPTDTLSIRLTAFHNEQEFDGNGTLQVVGANLTPANPPANQFDVANGGELQLNAFVPTINRNRYTFFAGTIDWDVGFADLFSSTSYGTINTTFTNDFTNANLAPGLTYGDFFPAFYGEPVNVRLRQVNELDKFNQEIRLTSNPESAFFGGAVDWLFGGFYTKEDITFPQTFEIVSRANGAILTTPFPGGALEAPATYEELAGFANFTIHLGDRFDLEVGGRYAKNWQFSQVEYFAGFATGSDFLNPAVKTSESKFTWSIAPKFKVNDDVNIYARVATGYRPGGPSLLFPGAPSDYPLSYKSDTTTNYEIGIKGAILDNRIDFDVAAYYIDWTDIQILSSYISTETGQRFNVTGNVGTAVSKGLEWALGWTIVEGLRLGVVGSYVDARLSADAPEFGGFDGDRLAYVPDWSNTVNLDYSFDLSDGISGTVGGSWNYIGTRYTDFSTSPINVNHTALPAYSLFHAQAGVDFGGVGVNVFVRNLTDERATLTYSSNGGFQATGVGTIVTPRTIGVNVMLRY